MRCFPVSRFRNRLFNCFYFIMPSDWPKRDEEESIVRRERGDPILHSYNLWAIAASLNWDRSFSVLTIFYEKLQVLIAHERG